MNCNQFEERVHDLVLGTLGEASMDEALAHAESCPACARLLADSRALRSGLRLLAGEAPASAPARLESVLLGAFRRERRTEAQQASRRRWAFAGLAAAAALLVVMAARERRSWHGHSAGSRPAAARVAQSAPSTNPAPASRTAPGAASAPRVWPLRPGPREERVKSPRHKPARQPVRPARPARNTGDIEWATDFLPLPYAAETASPEAGELVRIELPRSALTDLGLETTTQEDTVTAEVLIGEDGVARAIRFAQPSGVAAP